MARFRLLRTAGNHSLAAEQETVTVQHDDPSAAAAADLDIRAGADDGPLAGAAGMGLAGGDHIAEKNVFTIHNSSFTIHNLFLFAGPRRYIGSGTAQIYDNSEGRENQRGLQDRGILVE